MSMSNDAVRYLEPRARKGRAGLSAGHSFKAQNGDALDKDTCEKQVAHLENLLAVLKSAPKFSLEETFRRAAHGSGEYKALPENPRMPFPITVIENLYDGEKYIVVAYDSGEKLIVQSIDYLPDSAEWMVNPVLGVVANTSIHDGEWEMAVKPSPGLESFNPDESHPCVEWLKGSLYVCMDLMQILACANVETELVRPDAKLVKACQRRGKQPPFEYHILTVPGHAAHGHTGRGGHHASPRRHVVRGHIRFRFGKHFWVNAHMRGRGEDGIVLKDYVVTENA